MLSEVVFEVAFNPKPVANSETGPGNKPKAVL